MGVEAKVTGLPDFKRQLLALPEKLRKRALRNALAAGARVVRDAARVQTPVLSSGNALKAPYRTPGLVRKSIVVRTSKRDRREGNVGVFVNVRPAKGGARGAKSKSDPFYWRWLEFGWNPASRGTGGRGKAGKAQRRKLNKSTDAKIRSGFRFLQAGANRLNEALRIFTEKLRPAIDKLNRGQTP
jgi:HK97 gp10 family phage protein